MFSGPSSSETLLGWKSYYYYSVLVVLVPDRVNVCVPFF